LSIFPHSVGHVTEHHKTEVGGNSSVNIKY